MRDFMFRLRAMLFVALASVALLHAEADPLETAIDDIETKISGIISYAIPVISGLVVIGLAIVFLPKIKRWLSRAV
jgi:type IV secretory pathway VirB2 component (pilin)